MKRDWSKPLQIEVRKGYFNLAVTFVRADGTEEKKDGGWVDDAERGSLYCAFDMNAAPHKAELGWTAEEAIANFFKASA